MDSALSLEELLDPPLGLVPDSIVMELGSNALMRNFIKCLAIIQQDGIYLLMSVTFSSQFMFSDYNRVSQDLFFRKSLRDNKMEYLFEPGIRFSTNTNVQ